MKYDVLIIGAGAAGLVAMKELLSAGYHTGLLEAMPTPGGRISTLTEPGFEQPVETGAEFIHGKLPLTRKLLDDAGIKYHRLTGKMVSVQGGHWNKHNPHEEHWGALLNRLKKQKTDITINAFLEQHFRDEKYADLGEAVRRFAESYDLADPDHASILSVKEEWSHEDEPQFRVEGGYRRLTHHLEHECLNMGGEFHFNACVRRIDYRRGAVSVSVDDGRVFSAQRVIITVSIGVLKTGMITFTPALGVYDDAIRQIGFGAVTKLLFRFRTPFWEDRERKLGFLLSDNIIPTWWTQAPERTNLLTGWLGGAGALALSKDGEEGILEAGISSLARIFDITGDRLRSELSHYRVFQWHLHPFVLGGYSYSTLMSKSATRILEHPLLDTVFFAGEAIYQGHARGTVEAALQSGLATANKITRLDKKNRK